MRRRVRITGMPKAQSGLESKMHNLRAGLGFNANTMPWPIMAGKLSEPPLEVNNTLRPVPREEANLEAEKDEVAAIPTKSGIPDTKVIGGKRHYEGGTPLNLPVDSFIFSDTAKMRIKDPVIQQQFGMPVKKNGYTPAEIAKKYNVSLYKKILADRDADVLQQKTAEMMISNNNMMLAKLALVQESMKGFPQGIPAIAQPYVESMNLDPKMFEQMNPGGESDDQTAQADMMGRYGREIQLPRAQTGDEIQKAQLAKWRKSQNQNEENLSVYPVPYAVPKTGANASNYFIDPARIEQLTKSYNERFPVEGDDAATIIRKSQLRGAEDKARKTKEELIKPLNKDYDNLYKEVTHNFSRFISDIEKNRDKKQRELDNQIKYMKESPYMEGKELERHTDILNRLQRELDQINLKHQVSLINNDSKKTELRKKYEELVLTAGPNYKIYTTEEKEPSYNPETGEFKLIGNNWTKQYKSIDPYEYKAIKAKRDAEATAKAQQEQVIKKEIEANTPYVPSIEERAKMISNEKNLNTVSTPSTEKSSMPDEMKGKTVKVSKSVSSSKKSSSSGSGNIIYKKKKIQKFGGTTSNTRKVVITAAPQYKSGGSVLNRFDGGGKVEKKDGDVYPVEWVQDPDTNEFALEWSDGTFTNKQKTPPTPEQHKQTKDLISTSGPTKEVTQEDYDKLIQLYEKAKAVDPNGRRKTKEAEDFQKEYHKLLPHEAQRIIAADPQPTGKCKDRPDSYYSFECNEDGIFGRRTIQYMENLKKLPVKKKDEIKDTPGTTTTTTTNTTTTTPVTEKLKNTRRYPPVPPSPWVQDVNNLNQAFMNWANVKGYFPWSPPTNIMAPELFFKSPERALAENQSQMNMAANLAAKTRSPQDFYGTYQAISGKGFENAANVIGQVQNQNIDIANQQAMANAAAYNQNAALNAQRQTQLYDQTNATLQNIQATKEQRANEFTKAKNALITNMANKYNMNLLYPQYAVDPYGMIFYHDPKELKPEDQQLTLSQRYQKILNENPVDAEDPEGRKRLWEMAKIEHGVASTTYDDPTSDYERNKRKGVTPYMQYPGE